MPDTSVKSLGFFRNHNANMLLACVQYTWHSQKALALLSMCGDYSMSVHYFYSERVAQMSGPCKIIHGMEPLAGQLTGPLIIPGLSLQESRLTRPSRLKYLHLETDNINTHWTVFRWIHLGLFQAELLWIAN